MLILEVKLYWNGLIGISGMIKKYSVNAFYILNYVIYTFYLRKKDSVPVSASFFLPILFLYFNSFSLIYWAGIIFNFNPPFTKEYAIAFFIMLATLSYLVLYHKSRYKSIFEYFDKQALKNKKYNRYVLVYIVATILLFLSTLIAADMRFDRHL